MEATNWMTWESEVNPNSESLPTYHGLRTFTNGKLLVLVNKLVPEFDSVKFGIRELRVRIQEALQDHLEKAYPEIAGTAKDLQEILTNVLEAESSNKDRLDVSLRNNNINNFSNCANVSDSGISVENSNLNTPSSSKNYITNFEQNLENTSTVNFDIRFENLSALKNSVEETVSIIKETKKVETSIFKFEADKNLEQSYRFFEENLKQNKLLFSRASEFRQGFRYKHKSRLGTHHKNRDFLEQTRLEKIKNSEKEQSETFDWTNFFLNSDFSKMTENFQPIINFGLLAKPSVYTHTLDEDVREFIHIFENEALANEWNDATKLKKIRIAFKGLALKIFDEKIKDDSATSTVKTWEGMKKKILEEFKKSPALLRERLKKREYGGEVDFYEYCMFVTKIMREIDEKVPESEIVSKICDGLPIVERDWIWRYKPETLSDLDKVFGNWLEFKEKLKHKNTSEVNAEIKRLEEKVAQLETKEKNINEIVTAVVSSLGVVGPNPQNNATAQDTNLSQNGASQENPQQTANAGINAVSLNQNQMPIGIVPPTQQHNFNQQNYNNDFGYNNNNYRRGSGNRGNFRGQGRYNNNSRNNFRGNFNNNGQRNYNGNNNSNRGNFNNYNNQNNYRQFRPRFQNNNYGNNFRPRFNNQQNQNFNQNGYGNFQNYNQGQMNGNFSNFQQNQNFNPFMNSMPQMPAPQNFQNFHTQNMNNQQQQIMGPGMNPYITYNAVPIFHNPPLTNTNNNTKN